MQKSYSAIVIRQLETPYKIALLDRVAGRVDGIVSSPLVRVGSLIEYTLEKNMGTMRYIRHYSVVDMPFSLARADILFWHHVLELCYYFVPLGSFTQQLFELLEFLYTVDVGIYWRMRAKKLYLFKLLTSIGVYTRLPRFPIKQLQNLQSMPLAMITDEVINAQGEKSLDEWLRLCVYEHPAIRKFQTVHFLLSQ